MGSPLTVYTWVPRNWNASFYYRIFVPFHTANDLGLPVRVHVDTNDAGIDSEQRVRAFCESDVVMLYQPIGEMTQANAKMAKSFVPSKVDGEWKYPPSIVIDTDDNLFNVNPYNVAFKHLGVRDPDGKDIPLGHTIGVVQNGVKRVLWRDRHDGFDLARNRQTLAIYRNLVELSDAVTCSTRHVADCVRAEANPRRVEVFPNLVRFDHYEQVRLAEDPSRLKILWQGGASHYEDWFPLREALGEITKKYPHVHWLIWGQIYPWVTELIPPDRYTFVNWCAYQEYKLRLVMMGHDISLAPLADTRFNRCRSAIKWYEASVLRKPAATLAQNTGPYADEIQDGQTGLLFNDPKEFVEKLSTLIENASLRETLGANAKSWISEHRDAFKHVPKQMAFLDDLRKRAPIEQPHMPETRWEEFVARAQATPEVTAAPEPAEV